METFGVTRPTRQSRLKPVSALIAPQATTSSRHHTVLSYQLIPSASLCAARLPAMALPRAKLLRISLSRRSNIPVHCRAQKMTPLNLHPSVRLPLTRTLASHSSTEDSHHDAHESHYDAPGGWWLGVPPGETYKKEGWEDTMIYGYCGALLFGAVLYAYKPDTS